MNILMFVTGFMAAVVTVLVCALIKLSVDAFKDTSP